MLTFTQFVEELAKDEIIISPAEVRRMRQRFGDKTLQMGHVTDDGSIRVPVDCIVEAGRALGHPALTEAAEAFRNDQMVSLLGSAGAFVEKVAEARKLKLKRMVEAFQAERSDNNANQQWSQIERTIFGVEFRD